MFLKGTFQRHLITSAEQLFCSAVLASVDAVNLYCDFLTIAYLHNAAVYNLVVLKHFVPWDIFWSGGIENFWTQKSEKRSFWTSQTFWTISILHVWFLVPNCSNFLDMYIIYKNNWNFLVQRCHWYMGISTFCDQIFWNLSSLYVLNCLKYLRKKCLKN